MRLIMRNRTLWFSIWETTNIQLLLNGISTKFFTPLRCCAVVDSLWTTLLKKFMRGIHSSSCFNEEKALNAVLLIARKVPRPSMHQVAKILYFAEREHLAKYGRPIVGDKYIAMIDGPVPSSIYDIFKDLRGDRGPIDVSRYEKYFRMADKKEIAPVGEVDLDVFSDSEIKMIFKSIEENKRLGYGKRSEKSHDAAWRSTPLNHRIEVSKIAKAGGATDGMVDYINQVEEYRSYKPLA